MVGDVAQLDDESLGFVVQDGDRSRGLVDCEFRQRRGSYDHKRQVQQPNVPAKLRCWDFVTTRSDGTAVRLHPERSNNKIATYAVEGQGETPITRKGLGMSDGRGTFKIFIGGFEATDAEVR